MHSGTTAFDEFRQRNNWDLVRLILASVVVAYHSYVMTGLPVPGWYATVARGDLAVAGFFGLSGYMVAGSYDRATSLKTYFLSRACRIYPAYALSVLFALIVGLSVSTEPNLSILVQASVRYLLANLSFINTAQPVIPGAFENHLHPEINTAWWTLKIEVAFYFALPIFMALLKGRRGLAWALGLYLAGFAWSAGWGLLSDGHQTDIYARMARQLPGWTGYFVVGSCWYLYRDLLKRYRWPIILASATILLFSHDSFDLLAPLAITGLVLSAGLIGPHIPLNKFGDISFGIYIYHSPIIQLLIWGGIAQQVGALLTAAITMLFLIPLAWLSWTFIEHPFMRRAKARRGRVPALGKSVEGEGRHSA